MSCIKKIIFCFFIVIFNFLNVSYSEIHIVIKINDNIVTNYDLEKEISYLKILNKSLNSLSENQIYDLAKKSLTQEIIKKNEISKFININNEKFDSTPYLNNLLDSLKLDNIITLEGILKNKNSYTILEIEEKIKIQSFWNNLIFEKFKDKIRINKQELLDQINSTDNKEQKEFLLSEIIFKKKNNQTVFELINEIRSSINDIGFENTANLFSITESSKLGGLIGWVSEKNLAKPIINELNKIKAGQFTNVINVDNNFLILKINETRISEIKINKDFELKKLIEIETKNQIAKFSRMYFEKVSINYFINEK
jgi:peptidyl-prolyl cis-trans isomerase SurA